MERFSILVADDHPFFRQGVINTLRAINPGYELYEASDGLEVLDILKTKQINILFLDIEMPRMNGLQALRLINQNFPEVQIIVLTMSQEDSHIMTMYDYKINAYLLKNTGAAELKRCLELIQIGERYYSPDIAFRLYHLLGKEENTKAFVIPDFSEREFAVLNAICDQCSNEEIAKQLNISVSSVKLVRTALYEKIGCKTAAGLGVYATQNGLYKPERG